MAEDKDFLRVVAKIVTNDLPVYCTLGRGVKTIVDSVRDPDKEEVFALISSLANKTDGLSKEQFQTREQLEEFLALGPSLCLKDAARSGKIYHFMNMPCSPLCRSEDPVMAAGYVLTHPEYRGRGVYKEINLLRIAICISLGFIGGSVRTLATAISSTRKRSIFTSTGVIPNSLQMNDGTWVDDIIGSTYFNKLEADADQFRKGSGLQVKQRTARSHFLPQFNEEKARIFFDHQTESQKTFTEKFQNLSKKCKTGTQVYVKMDSEVNLQIEKWIRDAAIAGSGFAIDEFDCHGLHNRKFLQHTVTIGAFRKTDDQLVGGLVAGHSALIRTVGPSTVGGYIIIDEKHRRLGYAQDLLTLSEGIAQRLGVRNIISDILISPKGTPAFPLATRAGYTVTGQLEMCACLKDGMTNSLLVYKRLSSSKL